MILEKAKPEEKEVIITLPTEEVSNMINTHPDLKKLLKAFKTDNSSAFKCNIINEYKNGLTNSLYCITINDQLINIIVPIFSSNNTITWDIRFNKNIKNAILNNDITKRIPGFTDLSDDAITKLIMCPLFKLFPKTNKKEASLQLQSNVYLTDWLKTGYKGANGFSVYFMTDRIPDKSLVSTKSIKKFMFIKSLEFYTNAELKHFCLTYAEIEYAKFGGVERSAKTKIKNISDGLYAQIKIYLSLIDAGHNVIMDWSDGDDLGIDIQYFINDLCLNIDVKSTKSKFAKIAKNRKETDFYAICTWKNDEPELFGFLFKHHFWKSDLLNTTSPEKNGEIYQRSLQEIEPNIVNIDKLYNIHTNYETLKAKKYTNKLFNND